MTLYYRPIPMTDPARPADSQLLAGGWCWFDRVEVLAREAAPEIIGWEETPAEVLARLTAPRPPVVGLDMDRPRLMGILNVTPDSFSDGGLYLAPEAALARARRMAGEGADLLDIGGESTRPGAALVPEAEEIARTAPVIAGLQGQGLPPISIDTRKAGVARAALDAGAAMLNDVSALSFDPGMAACAATSGVPICLMHAQGDPETMQAAPRYDDVLLDVYDHLAARIAVAEAAGIARKNIVVDPGIGFGKTQEHNLALLARLSLFHGLGVPVLLGVSRKRFIGVIGDAPEPADRMPGSLALALGAVAQGVQILRVHDILPSRQGLALWQAAIRGQAGQATGRESAG
ncbi:dihydropteroate synthase [Frigidibacter sp. ROC022]|uniref:dihydropteroate synthase n=1 Tax=Frigidibacter sp. ROC022 TaxID=2971796 RepID=UPI00215A3ECD|nr:dihydropteroate synthase [Frigidibacter sp. ROC022]MCR8725257.1 dihydropteroate synthase [Frigidibacter sp. ROC022]